MAQLKKNAMAQFLFPLTDKTDMGSIESGITSNIVVKFYGVNHGGSTAMTSGTVSKLASVVHSGIFRQTLKAAETNYDHILYRVTHASAADQLIAFDTVDNDDSDLYSALTLLASGVSDATSAAQQANSRVLLNLSRVSDIASFLVVMSGVQSDIYSALSDFQSDFQSRVPKRVATDSQLSDLHSDLRSFLVVMSGVQSDVYSLLSDTNSDLRSLLTTTGVALDASTMSDLRSAITATVTASNISDIASAVWAHTIGTRVDSRVLLNLSHISDVYSLLSDTASDLRSLLTTTGVELGASTMSDLRSAIAGVTATLSASDISDIASAVRATLASDLSDILSAAVQANSRVLLNQSRVSDVYSLLSDLQSDFQSRVPKRVATDSQLSNVHSDILSALGNISVTLTASDISDIASAVAAATTGLTVSNISDIASAVWADIIGARVDSRVLLTQSRVSDVYSLLSDLSSDFQSRVPKLVATNSQLSDLHSDLRSHLLGLSSISSDIYSLLSDTASDLRSLLTTTGVELGASTMSDLRSAITAGGGALSASDISDIASAVRATLVSDLSDILSAAQQTNSRVLLNQSRVSDIYSLLSDVSSDLGVLSGVQSDLYSLLAAVSTGVTDLSAVGSNIYSLLSDLASDVQSRIPGRITPAASALAELSSDPGATPTPAQAAMLLYQWLKNSGKTTSTKRFLRNDAGTTVLSATISDNGTSYVQGRLG
jgi:uncharacterized protein YeeX (DUF496 family)